MPAASFSHDSGSIEFTYPPLRPPGSLDFLQAEEQSAGGVGFGFQSYATNDLFELTVRLTRAEVDTFKDFYLNKAHGLANPFTYTDVLGTATTVKFQKVGTIVERAYNVWSCPVQLRVQ